MSRLFTLDEANSMLPEVGEALREIISSKAEYDKAESTLKDIAKKISLSGGANVDTEVVLVHRNERNRAALVVRSAYGRIEEIGAQLKDLSLGLIDFPTLYHDREVLLCWRLGEATIEYWHDLDAGFRGRQAIDDEFRRNHKGGTHHESA